MKIPSGNITTRLPFIAVDDDDLLTPLTGLTTFTVHRNRNGAGPVAMTTPTITEADATNAPGEYWLLIDEDTTLESGEMEHMMTFTIAHTGMFRARVACEISNLPNRVPDALDEGFLKVSVKRVGVTTIGPSGAGGQKYGG